MGNHSSALEEADTSVAYPYIEINFIPRLGFLIQIAKSCTRWQESLKGSHRMGDGVFSKKISVPLLLINTGTCQMNII
jgi:hypothetical protein